MTETRKPLGPGGVPCTRAEALELSREIRRRAGTTLEPYVERAGEAQLRANDDPARLEAIAARFGVDVDELREHIDMDGSIHLSALVECLLDLMHWCIERDLNVSKAIEQASIMYRKQAVALSRRLVYEVADDSPIGPSADVFIAEGGA